MKQSQEHTLIRHTVSTFDRFENINIHIYLHPRFHSIDIHSLIRPPRCRHRLFPLFVFLVVLASYSSSACRVASF